MHFYYKGDARRKMRAKKAGGEGGDPQLLLAFFPASALVVPSNILVNDSALRLAPPTSAPSTSGMPIMPPTLSGVTLPPYSTLTPPASPSVHPNKRDSDPRIATCASWAWMVVGGGGGG